MAKKKSKLTPHARGRLFNRLHEYSECLVQGCGAVAYLTLNATTLAMQMSFLCDVTTRPDSLDYDGILKRNVDALLRALRGVNLAMEVLGNHMEEPTEADMRAVNPTFKRVHKALGCKAP